MVEQKQIFGSILPFERIVIALDSSPHSVQALEAALTLARLWDLSIHGVFVEDSQLHYAAEISFSREVSRFSSTPQPHTAVSIAQQIAAQRNRITQHFQQCAQRAKIAASFQSLRGSVRHMIAQALSPQDLLGLGCAGHSSSPSKQVGSNTLHWLTQTRRALLIAHESAQYGEEIAVFFDGQPASLRALDIGAALALRAGRQTIRAFLPQQPVANFEQRLALLQEHTRKLPLSVHLVLLPSPVLLHLVRAIEAHRCGFLLLPDSTETSSHDLFRWIGLLCCPLLVIRESTMRDPQGA